MREEHKLNKAIKQDGVDTQSEILEELKHRYPQYVESRDTPKAHIIKRRSVIFALTAVAACLAIIVPCAVLLPNKGGSGNNDRYCKDGEYSKEKSEFTLREYSEEHCSGNVLYFDWYEVAEDLYTNCYIGNDDKEILGVEEFGYLAEYDEMISLSVTKSNVYLSVFDQTIIKCDNEESVYNHTVKWITSENETIGIFEDTGYRYIIRIEQGQDENRLFELVTELLENN